MSEAPGARPRIADDGAAIGARLEALRRGCICRLHRDADGQVLSAWTNPDCALHGTQGDAAAGPLSDGC